MNKDLLVILTSILFSSSSQIILKLGSANVRFSGFQMETLKSIIFNPFIVGGIGMQVIALLLWVVALKKVQVSFAYPFISLGFILVLAIGYFFLGETVDTFKFSGIMLIIIGIICLSLSHA